MHNGRWLLARSLILVLLLAIAKPLGIGVLSDRIERQRLLFTQAEAALQRGDRGRARELMANLQGYPLLPYLRHLALGADAAAADPTAVTAFLDAYPSTPLAERVRADWLRQLAAQGRWQEYLAFYRPRASTEALCHALQALIATGREEEALERVAPIWLVGHSQPAACDPVFAAWQAAGRLTPGLVWERITRVMAADRPGLARYLGRYLPEGERPWLERWLAVRRNPSLVASLEGFAEAHPRRATILADGLHHLAQRRPGQAATAWEAAQARFAFPEDAAARVRSALGLALLDTDPERAIAYLDLVPATRENLTLQERRLRVALERRDWARLADWIDRMPDGEIKQHRWLYWQARAAEALGDDESAADLYRRAAAVRGFWGFLAADRIGRPYNLTHRPTEAREALRRLANEPAVRRIEELHALGRNTEVRQEWDHLIRDLDATHLEAAAVIAARLGWPDRAIFTLARSGRWDDLDLRFPVLFREQVRDQAAATGLPESWIFAVIRQESAFAAGAGSHAGAIGLMQLMPPTAREMADRLGLQGLSRTTLLDPGTNIALGSHYLARMSRRFGGHPVLATAAYNAGPGRVKQWLPTPAEPADLWIATIPFYETRTYVQRVLAYRLIYADRLGQDDGPLSAWLGPIGATRLSARSGSADPSG